MASVAWAREHGEASVDFLREEHAVAVVWQEGILKLVERLEVLGPCYADCWAVIAVAPCHVVAVLYEAHAWVVTINPLSDFLVVALEAQRFLVDVPVHAVF